MKSEHDVPRLRPVVTLAAAGLLGFAAACVLARGESLARADVAATASLDIERRAGEPRISYEVQWLEGAHVAGSVPDFVVEGERGPVRAWFVSQLEQQFWVESTLESPSGRRLHAPKMTTFEGHKVTVRMPREAGRQVGGGASTSVAVSGAVNNEHVQLSIRMTKVTPGAGRRGREEVEVRDVKCGLPDGGTVMLSMDAPVDGRERLILVTPRLGPQGKGAERKGRPRPDLGPVPPQPRRMAPEG